MFNPHAVSKVQSFLFTILHLINQNVKRDVLAPWCSTSVIHLFRVNFLSGSCTVEASVVARPTRVGCASRHSGVGSSISLTGGARPMQHVPRKDCSQDAHLPGLRTDCLRRWGLPKPSGHGQGAFRTLDLDLRLSRCCHYTSAAYLITRNSSKRLLSWDTSLSSLRTSPSLECATAPICAIRVYLRIGV